MFYQPVKSDIRTKLGIWQCDRISETVKGQRDDYKTGCLLDYPYFKQNYKLIALDLGKQHVLDANAKVMKRINFKMNLKSAGNPTMFFVIEEVEEIWDFLQETVNVFHKF